MRVRLALPAALLAVGTLTACTDDPFAAPGFDLRSAPVGPPNLAVLPAGEVGDTVAIGATRQLTVPEALVAQVSRTVKQPPKRDFVWTSQEPALATVSTTGLVRGVAPGAVRVIASNSAARVADTTWVVVPAPTSATTPPPPAPAPAPAPVPTTPVAVATRAATGMCLDLAGGSSANATAVVLVSCATTSSQQFTFTAAGEMRTQTGKCLDAYTAQGRDGDPVVLWDCHGGPNQRWTAQADGSVTGINGKCLDLPGANTASGTPLTIWACHGGSNQSWTLVSGASAPAPAPAPPPPAPAPAPAPSAAAATVFALVGNVPSVSAVEAMGPTYAEYESKFRTWIESHWTTSGATWDQANYYDRAMIYYVWWARTGNPAYLDRGHALALNYRRNYLEANNYGSTPHWAMLDGVALHYLLTGDEASRTAVGRVADNFSVSYYLNGLGSTTAEMENRMQARVLHSFVLANHIKAPSQQGHDWAVRARDALTKILSTQSADGAYRMSGPINQCGYNKPFMVGLLNDAMIRYHTLFERDARILPSVKRAVDYMWANDWDVNAQGFVYLDGPCNGSGVGAAPDLNPLIVSGFGFVYAHTGDATYRTRGDAAMAGGLRAVFWSGSKQFNEVYHNSFRYVAMR